MMSVFIGYIQDGDKCFSDLEGYAWALEQGEEKGYHCHLLLIYNGAVKNKITTMPMR
jgi:hypothetical protein